MSGDLPVKKTGQPDTGTPPDGSGSGADSALQAMIRKRPSRPDPTDVPPPQTQSQTPAKKPEKSAK
jgi:hypothetical protein